MNLLMIGASANRENVLGPEQTESVKLEILVLDYQTKHCRK
jgi:hypothetical protein